MKRTITEDVDRLKDLMQINEGIGTFANGAMSLAKRLFDIKNPEEKKAEVLQYITSGKNPHMLKAYNMYKDESPAKGEMFAQFYVDNPGYSPKWDGTKFQPMGNQMPLGEDEDKISETDATATPHPNVSRAMEEARAIVAEAKSKAPMKEPAAQLAFMESYLTAKIGKLIMELNRATRRV
jgi:hypothetical protein